MGGVLLFLVLYLLTSSYEKPTTLSLLKLGYSPGSLFLALELTFSF